MKKRIAGVLVVAALVLAAVLWPRAESTTELWPLALTFTPGAVEHYRFSYTQQNETVAVTGGGESAAIEGDVSLAGELSLEGRGNDEVLVRFESLAEHDFTIQGKPLLPDPVTVREQVLAETARARITPRGEVIGISFRDGAHPMFERLVQLVLTEAQLNLDPSAETWVRDERSLHGDVTSDYRATRDDARATVTKTRAPYQKLQALALHADVAQDNDYQTTAVISRVGRLLSLKGDESIDASVDGRTLLSVNSHIELTHVRTGRAERAVATSFEHERALGEVGFSRDAEEKSLRQRVDGLTGEQMLADLNQFGFGAEMPDHNRWLWRTTGLLRLEPELTSDLVAFFPSPTLRHEGRGLVLDLLVGAGHYRAQEGLVALLQTPAAQDDRRYSMLFQRLNLVQHPSPATIAFLEQQQKDSKGLQRDLATNALGSAAGHLVRAGEIERGLAISERLLAELGEQKSAEGQTLYLLALGNAGLQHHAEALVQYAGSPSSDVRWQTASALRKMTDDASRGTLVELAMDPVPRVQLRALASLHARGDISGDDVATIGQGIGQRRFAEVAYAGVVTLLAPKLATDSNVRPIFDAILGQDLESDDIKARIRSILGG